MLTAALSLLLVYGAVGMIVTVLVARPTAGPGFWRLVLLLALAGLLLGLGIRVSGLAELAPPGPVVIAASVLCALSMVLLGVLAVMRPERAHGSTMWLAAAAGIVVVLADPSILPAVDNGPFEAAVHVAEFATTPLTLGGIFLTMILAHWYLVEPRMPTAPLRRAIVLFAMAEVVKLVLVALVLWLHLPEWANGPGGLMRAFVLGDALFVVVRATLGVLAPIVLAWLTWKTVEIRSIQSATGILYAAVVFVLFGEVICVYLSLASGRPF